jgi:hypothetical protein
MTSAGAPSAGPFRSRHAAWSVSGAPARMFGCMSDVQRPGDPRRSPGSVAHIGVVIPFAFVVRSGRAEARRGASPVMSSDLIARRPSRAGSDCRLRI